jgi:hypothetical protein
VGLFDKAKEMMGKGKDSLDVDKAKETAGQAKDKADATVEQHADQIPDSVKGGYDKASEAAEKVVPGEDAETGGAGGGA